MGIRGRLDSPRSGEAQGRRIQGVHVVNWYLHSKFKLACAAFLAAFGLLAWGKIDSAQWVSFNTWLIGLYCGANVVESFVTKTPVDGKP